MTSSRTGHPARTTGTPGAPGSAHRRPAPRPPVCHEPHLDGLFTYCLSLLCDHEAATAVLGDVLHWAERRRERAPVAAAEHRAWLYALARWACLRRLAELDRDGGAGTGLAVRVLRGVRAGRAARAGARTERVAVRLRHEPAQKRQSTAEAPPAPGARGAPAPARAHGRELALLAWPEAAGIVPEQREALELSLRHRLTDPEVAAVLGLDPDRARDLLVSAACAVERSRAALAVARSGGCAEAVRIAGGEAPPSAPVRHGDLVRHVDHCPRCRPVAECAGAGDWPGTTAAPALLPVVTAPRAALAHAPRARGATPRFDRRGFPRGPTDPTARRHRLRARAVTTTVVVTVVAAPVLALWTAYGEDPGTTDGTPVSASRARPVDGLVEDGRSRASRGAGAGTLGGTTGTSVEVIAAPGRTGADPAGRLLVDARPSGDDGLVSLTAAEGAPVRWSATSHAPWLRLSCTTGTLTPAGTFVLRARFTPGAAPRGAWRARISVGVLGATGVDRSAVVVVRGRERPPGPRPEGSGAPAAPSHAGGAPTPDVPGGRGEVPAGPAATDPGLSTGPGAPGPLPSAGPGEEPDGRDGAPAPGTPHEDGPERIGGAPAPGRAAGSGAPSTADGAPER
ncbi:hypothetical protein [Streptomyces sp. NPDC002490]|uniref:hypothetical protein n=1 Tax=Streptomyces sp. NPDC002490 TaxID=3154416 RepID=UPI00331A6BFC